MFHLTGYSSSVTLPTNVALAGLVDPALSRAVTSSAYVFAERLRLYAGIYIAAGATRARINSPTLRQVNPPFLRPVNRGAGVLAGFEIPWFGDQPLWLPAQEEVAPEVSGDTAVAERATVLLWLSPGIQPVPAGQIITLRGTAAITAVANAWTLGAITFDQALPSRQYAVVGGECIGATVLGFRLAFPNQLYRPGSLGAAALTSVIDWRLMTRRMGLWGRFLNTAPPQLEILCTAADATQEVYLQIVPLSGQLGSMMGG